MTNDFEETTVAHIDELDLDVQREFFPGARIPPPPPPAPKPLTWWERRQVLRWRLSDVEALAAAFGVVFLWEFLGFAIQYAFARLP